MVAHFKVNAGCVPAHTITKENVEELLGRRIPWFQQGQFRGDDRHFAICPYCDNPIQLKGVYKRQENSPRPYGSHTGYAIDGFPFDALDLEFCPYKLTNHAHDKDQRRQLGPMATQLIYTAISEFDRIVLILRDDFGFFFSDAFAGQMLDQWFDSEAYLYTGAHLRNLPWMVAYFAPALNLFGQLIAKNAELTAQIREKVPQAKISDVGRLNRGSLWYALYLQCLHHKVAVNEAAGTLVESLTIRVQDFTQTNEAASAPTIYRKQIVFYPERFEGLMHTPQERAQRNESLLSLAKTIAKKRGINHV
jgi:hypothetical protein